MNKKRAPSPNIQSTGMASYIAEQDEYLDVDLTHIRQCAELVQEEQGSFQYSLSDDDLELHVMIR